ncbi:ABC transporter ATP-binding protein [Persicitalea sp.]|uniref:ABC transporter ATP-binding protein n=1 Tax=Persicitalea sp. TaxID=3100273 RepID=UPI0035931B3B
MTLLKVKSLHKKFDDKTVLSDINLDLKKSEWVGIIGESGSGKSTLLNILGRFIDADEGKVFLNNQEMPLVKTQLMKGSEGIKLVHQEYELFPNQTVRENIAYALRFYEPKYREGKVEELLQLTRLHEVQGRKAKLLSGGEKQRTALAQALAEVPELLLLDEPFAHLDQKNKQTLADAIEDLKSTHRLTCLFVTHDAGEALAWADRIMILREGEMIQEGSPEEVYQKPVNLYVAQLTGHVNLFATEKAGEWQMVRPNYLRVVKTEERARWKAVITKIRFKGTHYEYFCRTSDGEYLTFYRSRRDSKVGEGVFLACGRKHIKSISN